VNDLRSFVAESNGIEGIWRDPLDSEMEAHAQLLAAKHIGVATVERFVAVVAPGHRLRDRLGLDVRVGNHYPPPGGQEIRRRLAQLLSMRLVESANPMRVHAEYEVLHPFTDGNGRSGRALWAWHMRKVGRDPFTLPFLLRWYHDSLGPGLLAHRVRGPLAEA
jgi:hypothetical protein